MLPLLFVFLLTPLTSAQSPATPPQLIAVRDDQRGFEFKDSKQPFVPWGFNYDHDPQGRLLEDYWLQEWNTVERDFQEIRDLGANVVRIHLQFGRFMNSPHEADPEQLEQLRRLLRLAESTGLKIDLTGLGCYHKQDVPDWYDSLAEDARWDAQAAFWTAIAGVCRNSSAIFCYDLMNEPVVPEAISPDRTGWGLVLATNTLSNSSHSIGISGIVQKSPGTGFAA